MICRIGFLIKCLLLICVYAVVEADTSTRSFKSAQACLSQSERLRSHSLTACYLSVGEPLKSHDKKYNNYAWGYVAKSMEIRLFSRGTIFHTVNVVCLWLKQDTCWALICLLIYLFKEVESKWLTEDARVNETTHDWLVFIDHMRMKRDPSRPDKCASIL